MTTILHLITGLETGGAEHMLARLAISMHHDGHRSVVVSMTGPGNVGPLLASEGIELYSLDLRRGFPNPRGVTRLVRILRRVRPGILQTWLYHADLCGLIARRLASDCRLFWNIQCTESSGTGVVRRLLAWCSPIPDAVIVNSLTGKRFHEQLGYRPKCWEYIPNGCDTRVFRFDSTARQRLRCEFGIPERAVAIGLPARYHPMKDHANFLAAAARLAAIRPETVFVLAGTGTERSNKLLGDAIAAHGLDLRVRLLGERDDMAGVYSALDIATLSSAFGEGCPNVLGEAMSCGLPCAATDCGDAAELLGPTGPVVPPRDPEALAAAWTRLVAVGPDGRRSIGAEARNRVVRLFDLAAIVRRYEAVYALH
jgi:glycosyltransferase involved in cell wall biosynthesis